jgi:hypothetical protein
MATELIVDRLPVDHSGVRDVVEVNISDGLTRVTLRLARRITGRSFWGNGVVASLDTWISLDAGQSWTPWVGASAVGGIRTRRDSVEAPESIVSAFLPRGVNRRLRVRVSASARLVSELTVDGDDRARPVPPPDHRSIAFVYADTVIGVQQSTLTIPAFATSGEGRFAFVGVTSSAGTANLTTSVVRGGTESFQEVWDLVGAGGAGDFHCSGHAFVGPATASASVVVTYGGQDDEQTAGVVVLDGVAQSDTLGTPVTASSASTSTSTVTVGTAAGEWVIDVSYGWGATHTAGADQTPRWEEDGVLGFNLSAGSSTQPGTAGGLMTWTGYTDGNKWVIGAVSIRPLAASGYTLGADSGAYSLAGSAASPLLGRAMSAAAGSYTFSGQTASPLLGRKVAASAGSYSLTGTAVSLLATRILGASAGSYSWDGTDAGLYRGYPLTAEAGSYALVGTAASPLFGRAVGAEAGSYALTGTAVGLLYSRLLSAEATSYSWTGSDADLAHGVPGAYILTADAGAYVWTGTAVSPLFARLVTAEAGSYALTGSAVSPLLGRLLGAAAGAYTLTGTDASFARAYVATAEAGSYSLTGAVAGLLMGRRLTSEAGSYSFTGQAAGAYYGRAVGAEAGSYAWSGEDATFPRTYVLTSAAGSYSWTGSDASLIAGLAWLFGEVVTFRAESFKYASLASESFKRPEMTGEVCKRPSLDGEEFEP